MLCLAELLLISLLHISWHTFIQYFHVKSVCLGWDDCYCIFRCMFLQCFESGNILFFFLKLCPNEDIHNTRVSGFKYEEKQSWKPAQRALHHSFHNSSIKTDATKKNCISCENAASMQCSGIWKQQKEYYLLKTLCRLWTLCWTQLYLKDCNEEWLSTSRSCFVFSNKDIIHIQLQFYLFLGRIFFC